MGETLVLALAFGFTLMLSGIDHQKNKIASVIESHIRRSAGILLTSMRIRSANSLPSSLPSRSRQRR